MATTEPSEIERPDLSELDDGALVQLARDGVHDAYAALYSRHAHPAQRLARHLGMRDEAEDVVSESFAQVLELMRRGKGPETSFRAYLFTTIRHDSARRAKARQKLVPTDDDSAIDTLVGLDAGQLDAFEASAIRAAYTSLPARWRTVLWQVEVERRKPQDLAPVLGLSPNGVSALAYRARSALREAYLKQHLRSACSVRPQVRRGPGPPARHARGAHAETTQASGSRAPGRLRGLPRGPARARGRQRDGAGRGAHRITLGVPASL